MTTSTLLRGHLRSLTLSVIGMVLAALLLLPGRAGAQEFRGTISGTVTDSTSAVVKDAQVTITETSTGTVNRTKTDSAGQYVVPFLQPGTYQIVVEMASFKKDVRNGLTLQANAHPLIDMALQIGSAQETISVTEDAPLVDTANASVGQVITTRSRPAPSIPSAASPFPTPQKMERSIRPSRTGSARASASATTRRSWDRRWSFEAASPCSFCPQTSTRYRRLMSRVRASS
jgi:hypothetical protein